MVKMACITYKEPWRLHDYNEQNYYLNTYNMNKIDLLSNCTKKSTNNAQIQYKYHMIVILSWKKPV